ncbi:hypothetical protein HDU83_004268 [Entophlyctis luteolus]|nr:hypothetical protein HDU83_004268 [Entophlyctis luteolus]
MFQVARLVVTVVNDVSDDATTLEFPTFFAGESFVELDVPVTTAVSAAFVKLPAKADDIDWVNVDDELLVRTVCAGDGDKFVLDRVPVIIELLLDDNVVGREVELVVAATLREYKKIHNPSDDAPASPAVSANDLEVPSWTPIVIEAEFENRNVNRVWFVEDCGQKEYRSLSNRILNKLLVRDRLRVLMQLFSSAVIVIVGADAPHDKESR